MTEIISVLLFITIMAIIIIGLSAVLKKMRAKKKREKEEELEELRKSWKEEQKEKKRQKERLAELFLQIESQVSQELSGGKSANRIVSLPKCKLFRAPGEDIQEFLKMIAVELSRKRTEYLVVGLLDEKGVPLYMLEMKGRSVWVDCNIEAILDKALEVNAASIVCIHNHPTFSASGPNLAPSEADISSGFSFYARCNRRGLNFLGDLIVSKGDYEEFLMPLIREVQPNITGGDQCTPGEFQVVGEAEQKVKGEEEKEFQVIKDTPVFLVDEIPLSVLVEPGFLLRKDYCKKWTFLEIADYVEEDIKTIYALIVQGRTPIVKRVGDRGQYVWLARKKDFDMWIQKYKAGHEG